MAFASGPVTFKRFFVAGSAPERVSQDLLDRVARRAIGKGSVAARDGSEAGWVTGDHILDTQFDFGKNVIAECLYLAMRVDANKPPSEIVRSYQKMHEQALLEKSGREFLSRQERREAREAARDQAEKEAKAGRFRRMRQYPMLWDLARNQVYLAATAPAVVDRFAVLFQETFGHALTAATAGELASRFAGAARLTGAYEELRPAQFTTPPDGAELDRSAAPGDESRSKDYLGTEWLTWLWYRSRHEEVEVAPSNGGDEAVERFEKSLQLDCPYGMTGSVSLRTDDPSHSPEAVAALTTGKLPVRAGLQIVHRGEAYACTVRGDRMHFSGVLLPAAAEPGNPRVLFEERTARLRDFLDAVSASYNGFLKQRLSSRWPKLLAAIRAWIATGSPVGADGTLTGVSAAS
ncbi:MAG: hypothetical protein ACPMAQ_13790 [Phycisphaerae bacterium]